MKKWEDLPEAMRKNEVRSYYDILCGKKATLFAKRMGDVILSILFCGILAPVILVLACMIKLDSKGPAFFLQERVTKYGRTFNIIKLRTMAHDPMREGVQVTTQDDARITKAGEKIRKYRLDELPQIFNIVKGDMSFVGTRPETRRYVECYSDEMWATLLLPAGVTSLASIRFKDEECLLKGAADVEKTYVEKVLPEKMKYNLDYLRKFSIKKDLRIIFATVKAIFGKQ